MGGCWAVECGNVRQKTPQSHALQGSRAKRSKPWEISGPRQNSYLYTGSRLTARRAAIYQQKYQQTRKDRPWPVQGDAARAHFSCRRKQNSLEIWRQTFGSACQPCLARVWLAPSLSPRHTFSWRYCWRNANPCAVHRTGALKPSSPLEPCAQRISRAASAPARCTLRVLGDTRRLERTEAYRVGGLIGANVF